MRYGRMAESPFAFFRGGAAIMAMDLSTTPVTGLTVQACGDAHVANFGTFATPERNIVFDINDFDETDRGPWEWDVKRLATSLHVVAREHGFASARARRGGARPPCACTASTSTSTRGMRTLDVWYDRTTADDLVAHFPKRYRAQARARRHRARCARTTSARWPGSPTDRDGRPRFVEDPPIVVHLDALEPTMDDVDATVADYRESLTDERRFLFDRFRVVDVARRVVGVGSVGTRCWVALLEAVAPADDVPDRIVLQVKEAQPSVLAPYVGPDGRRSPGAAGGGRPAPHPGRQRPLPRVVRGAERPPLLRAPALGREGPGRPDEDGPGQAHALRRPLRLGARPRPRPDRRRRGHRRLPRTGAGRSTARSPGSPRTTRPRTSGITPPWSTPSRQVA